MIRPAAIAAVPRCRPPLVLALLACLLPAATASAEWVQTQKLTADDAATGLPDWIKFLHPFI